MPKRWQDYMRTTNNEVTPVYHHPTISNNGAWLLDSLDPELSFGLPGRAKLRGMLLDRYNYHACMLTLNVGAYGGHVNPELAVAICRAVNDWNIDHWLSRDEALPLSGGHPFGPARGGGCGDPAGWLAPAYRWRPVRWKYARASVRRSDLRSDLQGRLSMFPAKRTPRIRGCLPTRRISAAAASGWPDGITTTE